MNPTAPTAAAATPAGEKRKALGRGLESLLPRTSSLGSSVIPPHVPAISHPAGPTIVPAAKPATHDGMREVPLGIIERNPYQTRQHLDEAALAELIASIKSSGVVQPIVLRPISAGRYQLVAGQRRWEASKRAGKTSIPAVVRELSDQQAMELTIIENIQRQDLNTMEQARAFERLGREFGLTQENMAQRTGIDRTTVSNFVRLLKLPVDVQALIEQDKISFGHAKVLLSLDSPEAMLKLGTRVAEEQISVRALEQMVFAIQHPVEKQVQERQLDPNVRQAQMEMERSLGVRVQIKDRNGRGKIVIEYKSLEDFDRVVEMLGKK